MGWVMWTEGRLEERGKGRGRRARKRTGTLSNNYVLLTPLAHSKSIYSRSGDK